MDTTTKKAVRALGSMGNPKLARKVARVLANVTKWPGANKVYERLYKVLEQMGQELWRETVRKAKKTRRKIKSVTPSQEMTDLIDALGKGDEEQLKGLVFQYRDRGYKM